MSVPELTPAQRRVLECIRDGKEPPWQSANIRRLYLRGYWTWGPEAARVITLTGLAALENLP